MMDIKEVCFVSMVYKFFDKKTLGGAVTSELCQTSN